jgi:hypothetical protein
LAKITEQIKQRFPPALYGSKAECSNFSLILQEIKTGNVTCSQYLWLWFQEKLVSGLVISPRQKFNQNTPGDR